MFCHSDNGRGMRSVFFLHDHNFDQYYLKGRGIDIFKNSLKFLGEEESFCREEPRQGPRVGWRILLRGAAKQNDCAHLEFGPVQSFMPEFNLVGEGVKKTFFGGTSVPNMGGWGCRFPNFQ